MKADYGVFKKEYRGTGFVDEKVPLKMLVGGLVLEVVTSVGVRIHHGGLKAWTRRTIIKERPTVASLHFCCFSSKKLHLNRKTTADGQLTYLSSPMEVFNK